VSENFKKILELEYQYIYKNPIKFPSFWKTLKRFADEARTKQKNMSKQTKRTTI